jgi:isocitrate dehydrogenase
MLMAAVMMLNHIGQPDVAEWVHNAWLRTIEDGIHTYDIRRDSGPLVGTSRFAQEVISRLGSEPEHLAPVRYQRDKPIFQIPPYKRPAIKKDLLGADVFLFWEGSHVDDLMRALQHFAPAPLKLELITNRGVAVWPEGYPETFCTDHWRLRLLGDKGRQIRHTDVIAAMAQLQALGLEFIKTELLYEFDGVKGFS